MIDSLREDGFGVGPVCRVLGWSESAYYARRKRPKSTRRLRDEQLMPLIQQVHAESGGTYGARRITRALRRKAIVVARCTVERLMGELGLEGVIRGQRRRTTVPEPSAPRPPDLVDRDFTASRPDQLWVADMTYEDAPAAPGGAMSRQGPESLPRGALDGGLSRITGRRRERAMRQRNASPVEPLQWATATHRRRTAPRSAQRPQPGRPPPRTSPHYPLWPRQSSAHDT
ncbi:IS3 family transposase [Streptomyces sp. NPDC088353]|uniref:IS3 family transposase n=1 Tax=Streptomyces sp. NPDC088353 TaxID=3365855 RepID=UPI0037FB6079